MNLKNLLITAGIIVLVYVGIQFASALVGHMQIKNILETEALEARRYKHSEEQIIQNVISHMNRTNTDLPEEFDIGVDGAGKPDRTLVIEMDYESVVDLHFWEVVMNMTATADAKPPIE